MPEQPSILDLVCACNGDCRKCEPTCPLLDGREVADLVHIREAVAQGHSQSCAELQVRGGTEWECEKERTGD